MPKNTDYLYSKVKYYSSLTRMQSIRGGSPSGNLLDLHAMPAHVVPPELFGLSDAKPGVTQSSWQTIMSIVNTMMGSTIVAVPYALAQSGVAAGLVSIAMMGAFSCFTCILVVEHGHKFDDFTDFVNHYLGRAARYISWFFSVFVILGAATAYHILMSSCLYHLVRAAATAVHATGFVGAWAQWQAAVAILLVYPLTILKNPAVLVKFNSAGFLFLWYTILFILYHGFHGLSHGTFSYTDFPGQLPPGGHPARHNGSAVTGPYPEGAGSGGVDDNARASSADAGPAPSPFGSAAFDITLIADWGTGAFLGMMMLAFFIHNCIQPITKHAEPTARRRDISLAYATAAVLYGLVGTLGYYGFADLDKSGAQITPNFLDSFASTDIYASTARLSLFLQLVTVYPLLCLIIRTQVIGLLYHVAWPGLAHIMVLSAVVMGLTTTVAALGVQVTAVLTYTGAIAGLVIVFVVPIAVDVVRRRSLATMTVDRWLVHALLLGVAVTVFTIQFVPLPTAKHVGG